MKDTASAAHKKISVCFFASLADLCNVVLAASAYFRFSCRL